MTTFPMPSPGYPLGRNGDGAMLSGPVAEVLARTTKLYGYGAAYDQMPPDIPRVEKSGALPRSTPPSHVTPVASGLDEDDDDDIVELADRLIRACTERGVNTSTIEQWLEGNFPARAADAGPTPQTLVDDQSEPLDAEAIERITKHLKGRLSDRALQQLEDMLRTEASDADPMPAWLKGREDELQRAVEHLDPRSASDNAEAFNAIELMRQRGALDQPPPFPARPTPGSSPLPGRQEREGIDRKRRMAGDSGLKSFAKLCGVKRKQLPRVLG